MEIESTRGGAAVKGTELVPGRVYRADGEYFIADDEGGVTELSRGIRYSDVGNWVFEREVNAKLVIES